MGALRLSMGEQVAEEQLEAFAQAFGAILKRLGN
jgi:cysteine sulfinate desulfinase/cysteine desulfurase-like protein